MGTQLLGRELEPSGLHLLLDVRAVLAPPTRVLKCRAAQWSRNPVVDSTSRIAFAQSSFSATARLDFSAAKLLFPNARGDSLRVKSAAT
jgi:hypothetical protein